jgi:ribosomal protein L16 Arg81 hydroxylase
MDPYDNFFMQLMGQKTFHLYPPSDRKYLYPCSPFGSSPEASLVDPLQLDLEKFPLARHATRIEITLKAGDALFLPIYWWHAVQGALRPPCQSISGAKGVPSVLLGGPCN